MMASDCPFYDEYDCERYDCCECEFYQIYCIDEENEEENNKG